jgi:nucleoside-diphosphate-sugar epimerase
MRSGCDNRKLRELTGFQPLHDLRSGLRTTIGWFLEGRNLAGYKTDIYNV